MAVLSLKQKILPLFSFTFSVFHIIQLCPIHFPSLCICLLPLQRPPPPKNILREMCFGSAGQISSHTLADHRWDGYWGGPTNNPGLQPGWLQDWSAQQLSFSSHFFFFTESEDSLCFSGCY